MATPPRLFKGKRRRAAVSPSLQVQQKTAARAYAPYAPPMPAPRMRPQNAPGPKMPMPMRKSILPKRKSGKT